MFAVTLPVLLSAAGGTPHFEVGVFGGGQFWKLNRGTYPLPVKLAPGFLFGGRVGYDINSRWGVEGSVSRAGNDEGFELPPTAGLPRADFGAHNLQFMGGPMYYLKPPSSRIRPFLTGGPGLHYFRATDGGKQAALDLQRFRLGPVQLNDNVTGAFFYGGGVKAWLTRKVNARFDVRGILSLNPHIRYFALPRMTDQVQLPAGGSGHGLQLTAGLGYAIASSGWDKASAIGESGSMRVKVEGPGREIYQGDAAKYTASTDSANASQVKYLWRLNDQNIGGGESISIDTSNLTPGAYPVTVVATAPGLPAAKGDGTLTVLPAVSKELKLTLSAPSAKVYRGDKAAFSIKSDAPEGTPASYAWTVDGKSAGTGETIAVDTNDLPPGTYPVEATGSASGYKSGSASSVLTVLQPNPPRIHIIAPAGDVKYGDRVAVSASVEKGEGGGTPGPVNYSASDGSLTGNELDTSTLQFDTSTPGRQRKVVKLTASVTDDKNLSASATAAVTVVRTITADATRLPDVVFARNNSRVNNCGKRVLLEELKAYLDSDPSARVILVAHVDNKEIKTVGRRRAMNAAAVITAGSGICLGINPKQVLIGLAAAGRTSEPISYLCGTSTQEKGVARGGRLIRMTDKRAQYRRVEVWFVPTGAKLPPGLGKLRSAAAYKVSALGCPR